MTLPALRALRLSNPGAKISLLVKPWVSPIFEKDPNVDELIIYSADYGGLRGRIRLAAQLRRQGFRHAVLFQNAFDAALIALLAGIPERTGYSRDARRLLLTKAVPFDKYAAGLHHIGYYLSLLERAGYVMKSSRPRPWIYLSLEERLEARKKLAGLSRPVTGINPGFPGVLQKWQKEWSMNSAEVS